MISKDKTKVLPSASNVAVYTPCLGGGKFLFTVHGYEHGTTAFKCLLSSFEVQPFWLGLHEDLSVEHGVAWSEKARLGLPPRSTCSFPWRVTAPPSYGWGISVPLCNLNKYYLSVQI